MIDLKALRENPARFALGAKAKNVHVDIDKLLQLDEKKRGITIEREKLRSEQNRLSKEAGPQIGKLQGALKGVSGDARAAIEKQLEELKEAPAKMKAAIQELEAQVRELKARPAPAPTPSPPHVSADATAFFLPQLPPLDDSRMTPALASTAAALRARFTTASSDAQALMRTMCDIRMEWDLLPLMPSQSGMWHCCEMLPFTLHPAAAQHLTASASAQPPFFPSQ
jgi:hypothetical protein